MYRELGGPPYTRAFPALIYKSPDYLAKVQILIQKVSSGPWDASSMKLPGDADVLWIIFWEVRLYSLGPKLPHEDTVFSKLSADLESPLLASVIWTIHPENLNISVYNMDVARLTHKFVLCRLCLRVLCVYLCMCVACFSLPLSAGSSQRAGIVFKSLCLLPNPLWPW